MFLCDDVLCIQNAKYQIFIFKKDSSYLVKEIRFCHSHKILFNNQNYINNEIINPDLYIKVYDL